MLDDAESFTYNRYRAPSRGHRWHLEKMAIVGDLWSGHGVEPPDEPAPVTELAPMTLRVIKHELRTPINHIIGYSEILIEDLTSGSDAEVLSAMHVVLAAGREMLAVINARVGGAGDPDSLVSADVLLALRLAVRGCLERVRVQQLEQTSLTCSAMFSADIRKILDATRRLDEFARTGRIPAS